MPPKLELVREWLRLARADLDSARHLFHRDPPLLETACFHAQQTVEKALKAVLLPNEQRPPRSHNLEDLIGLCHRWMPGLASFEESCAWLTACAVRMRYPDNAPAVTRQLTEEALQTAEAVLQHVLNQSPSDAAP
jgi:HEPN domain-containing protein